MWAAEILLQLLVGTPAHLLHKEQIRMNAICGSGWRRRCGGYCTACRCCCVGAGCARLGPGRWHCCSGVCTQLLQEPCSSGLRACTGSVPIACQASGIALSYKLQQESMPKAGAHTSLVSTTITETLMTVIEFKHELARQFS